MLKRQEIFNEHAWEPRFPKLQIHCNDIRGFYRNKCYIYHEDHFTSIENIHASMKMI